MEVKVKFNDINVKEEKEKTLVKILMLKGEKGDKGDSATWGEVGGTLSDQTDLQNALNLKANQSDLNTTNQNVGDLQNEVNNNHIVESGASVIINDAIKIKSIKIFGDTVQEGTPTPSNPIEIKNVTNDVTVTVGVSGNYTLSLGDIELCKIGEHKDYIYNSEGKWYLKKSISKTILNGVESWGYANNVLYHTANDSYIGNGINIFTTHFIGSNSQGSTANVKSNNPNNSICLASSGSARFYVKTDIVSSYGDFRNWLSTHNVTAYYISENPTTIEITDTTLINQLNELLNINLEENTTISINAEDVVPTIEITAYKNTLSGKVDKNTDDINSKPNSNEIYNKVEVNEKLDESNYIDEITYSKKRFNNETDYYIVTIPKNDSNGNQIDLYVGYGGSNITPIKYAQNNFTSLTINASLTIKNTITGVGQIPSIISNGEIIRNNDLIEEGIADNLLYVGIKADRSIVEYKVNETTAQQMLEDGVVQAFDVYWKLVDNGVPTDLSNIYSNEGNLADSTQSPRQCIGIKQDGTILIITGDGRTSQSIGLYCHDLQQIAIDNGCVNAWNLDGGGSTSTIIKGSKLNRNVDEGGTKDRYIPYTLNAKKEITSESVSQAFSKIGEEKQNIIQQIIPYINSELQNKTEKIVTQILGYGYEINEITQDNVFEPVLLNNKYGNTYSLDNIILGKINQEDEYNSTFKINKKGYFRIDIITVMKVYADGDKFIKLCRNDINDEVTGSNKSNYMSINKRGQIVTSFLINNTSVDDVYIVGMRGKAGDSLYQTLILISEVD